MVDRKRNVNWKRFKFYMRIVHEWIEGSSKSVRVGELERKKRDPDLGKEFKFASHYHVPVRSCSSGVFKWISPMMKRT